MKYFALAALASVQGLEFYGNQTSWDGNSHAASGADFTFDLSGTAFNNGTGSCTLTSNAAVSSINVPGFAVDAAVSAQGPWTFWNMRASDPSEFKVLVTGELEGSAFDSADFSVACDSSVLADGDLKMGSFPNHNEAADQARNGQISAKGAVWGSFVMSWPGAVNISFFDERVVADGSGTSEITVDASTVDSEDLWFSYESNDLTGSYEITLVNV